MSFLAPDRLVSLRGRRILVLGDVMLDTFVYGHCARISPEAPIPVVRIEREDVMLGGAGNVARNIAALGGEAVLIGLIGEDTAGATFHAKVAEEPGIFADLVVDGRPTTQKIRYVAAQQQMLRADIEQSHTADPTLLLAAFERQLQAADAVVLSDYAKGVLSPDLLRAAIARARTASKPIIADPKSADVARYDGVTLLTPNAGEAALATGIACDEDAAVQEAAERLLNTMPASPAVLITRGPRGMTLARRGAGAIHLPALARDVFDVSGAGDTVVATLAVALAAGVDVADAAELANVAAGKAVSKPGTAVVTLDELAEELEHEHPFATDSKVASLDDAVRIAAGWRQRGARIGFTNGCFDLLHPGHISQLAQARAQCDHLIVALNTDESVSQLKGPHRPVQGEEARATVLAALASVDLVILFGEETPIRVIEALRPDVLIKGKDYSVGRIAGADLVLGYGGEVFLADLLPGHSTTNLISRASQPETRAAE
jgi:D-beta-D-heptose 7-phosphate kinase/D-beta-D-heptose 1-phosphate adenosyltransferase